MGRFALLGVMLCLINAVSPVTHSWKAFYTANVGMSEFPEFVAVHLVNDEYIGYFDSTTSNYQHRQKWMEENMGQDYVKRQTDTLKGKMQTFKVNMRIAMERFNQSGGIHVVQQTCGCEWDDETGTTDGFNNYGHDGEDFVAFDLKNTRWISPSPQGLITTYKWNDQAYSEYRKNYYTKECIEWLKKFVSYGRSTLERTVAPEVSLLQKDPSSHVVCHVTGFFPHGVMVTWQRNGEELSDDVELGETVPNQDGTFQKTSRLTVKDWQTEDYTCTVQHKSLEKDIIKRVTEQEIRRNQDIKTRGSSPDGSGPSMGVIIGCVVAVLLALAGIGVIGVMLWKKRSAGYGMTNTSDTDSENSGKPAVQA